MFKLKKNLCHLLAASVLISLTNLPMALAANSTLKSGAPCKKIGLTASAGLKNLVCSKNGKKLVWLVGSSQKSHPSAPSPTPTAMPSPTSSSTPSPSPVRIYVAKDQKNLRHFVATAACANPATATFEIQAFVDGVWIPIKLQKFGWNVDLTSCPSSRLGLRTSLAWADGYLDGGVTYRWHYVGDVNIFNRDDKGNGYSVPQTMKSFVTPYPVENGYGITWDNLTSRVNDISAAAWIDAQATIKRNQVLPSAADNFTSYITQGALKIDPKVADTETLLKNTFALFAKYPAGKKVFFIALTKAEKKETENYFLSNYANANGGGFIIDKLEETYPNQSAYPAGSVAAQTECNGMDLGKNGFFYREEAEAAVVILGVCPDIGAYSRTPHFAGTQGTSHEYIHTIQFAFKPGTGQGFVGIPCWMREGEPEWGQTAAAMSFSDYLYSQNFHPYKKTQDGKDFQAIPARQWSAVEVESYLVDSSKISTCMDTNTYAYSYSLGAATIEALVSIAGSESFFALHERLVAGIDLNVAFEELYGIAWDKAVPILAQVVATKITKASAPDQLTYQTRPAK